MRVTSDMQYQQLLRQVRRNFAEISQLQNQVSTGVRLQRPSDGPSDMGRVIRSRHIEARMATHLTTIRDASNTLLASTNALTAAKDTLLQAKEVALQASNSAVSDPSANEALAQKIDGLINSLLQIANQRLPDGRFLLSGTASQTQPFAVTARDVAGRPTSIVYQGAAEDSQVLVGQGQTVSTLIAGSVLRLREATVPGEEPRDAFQILMALRDDIRNTAGLADSERNAALTQRLDELDRISTRVLDALGSQGVQLEQLERLKDRTTDAQITLQKQTDELESVDVAEAITKLSQQQNLYQISLSLITQLNSLDLSRFLQ